MYMFIVYDHVCEDVEAKGEYWLFLNNTCSLKKSLLEGGAWLV